MYEEPSRHTLRCPDCGEHLTVLVRYPKRRAAGHVPPVIDSFDCDGGCALTVDRIADFLGFTGDPAAPHTPPAIAT